MDNPLHALYIIGMSQIIAPTIMFQTPCLTDFKVKSVKELSRGMYYNYHGHGEDWLHKELREESHRLIIYMDNSAFIGINLENNIIEEAYWGPMCVPSYSGSGSAEIGIVLFGLPTIILTAPLWLPYQSIFLAFKPITGMDYLTCRIWQRIKNQIPAQYKDIVYKAFLNHCNGVEDKRYKEIQAAWNKEHGYTDEDEDQ